MNTPFSREHFSLTKDVLSRIAHEPTGEKRGLAEKALGLFLISFIVCGALAEDTYHLFIPQQREN